MQVLTGLIAQAQKRLPQHLLQNQPHRHSTGVGPAATFTGPRDGPTLAFNAHAPLKVKADPSPNVISVLLTGDGLIRGYMRIGGQSGHAMPRSKILYEV